VIGPFSKLFTEDPLFHSGWHVKRLEKAIIEEVFMSQFGPAKNAQLSIGDVSSPAVQYTEQIGEQIVEAYRDRPDIGVMINDLYPQYLAYFGDEDMASVATAEMINDILAYWPRLGDTIN
jgi:hypothetical protein